MNQFANKTSLTPCKSCGKENYSVSYLQTSQTKQCMDAESICFQCAHWMLASKRNHETVIDGRLYTVGDRPKGSEHNGMAGRRFDIEYFDGRTVTTYDMWSGGEIPENYRAAIPDTARFLGGAGFVKIGDGGAWNASAPKKEQS